MIPLLRAATSTSTKALRVQDPESKNDVLSAGLGDAERELWTLHTELLGDHPATPIDPCAIGLRPADFVAVLDTLWVPPAERGSGIGSFLLGAVEDWARKNGAKAVLLHAGNMETGGGPPTPIPFYRRHGYTVLDQVGLVALMVKRIDGNLLRIDEGLRVPEPIDRELPPELPLTLLRHLATTAANAFPGYDDSPCTEMSDACDREARTFGLTTWVSNAGARLDPSHAYVVLRSRDPRWDFTILDPSIRQYLDAPKASRTQRELATPYPHHPTVPDLAIVPPGHPFYARMGYNPDPNVGTVEDPNGGSWRGGRFPSGAWRPPLNHRLWRMWDPEQEIYYPLEPGEKGKRPSDAERIARAKIAVRSMMQRVMDEIDECEDEEEGKYLQEGLDQRDFSGEELRRLAREARLPLLGTGASRAVFDFGKGRALKIPWNADNAACNLSELDTWQNAPDYVRTRLVPILDGDSLHGSWLLFPLVRVYSAVHDGDDVLRRAQKDLYAKVCRADKEGLYLEGIDDLDSGRNWAWHRGRLKALDYAGCRCLEP